MSSFDEQFEVIDTRTNERGQTVEKVRYRESGSQRRDRGFMYVIRFKRMFITLRKEALYDLVELLDDVTDSIEDGLF